MLQLTGTTTKTKTKTLSTAHCSTQQRSDEYNYVSRYALPTADPLLTATACAAPGCPRLTPDCAAAEYFILR